MMHGQTKIKAFFSSGLATSVAMEIWSMTIVRYTLPGHLISRFEDVPWPPCSPNLSACDFFLFGVFEIACLHSQTPYVEWFEGSYSSGNLSDRSSVVGPCHGWC